MTKVIDENKLREYLITTKKSLESDYKKSMSKNLNYQADLSMARLVALEVIELKLDAGDFDAKD